MNSFASRITGLLLIGAFFVAVSATSASAQCGNSITNDGAGEVCDNGGANASQAVGCCAAGCEAFVSAGTQCRAASGTACDLGADVCDGTSATCPNPVAPNGTVCRAAASLCDIAETCDGTSNACPADAVASGGTVCRSSQGDCDVVETCDGTSGLCPADAKSTALCRADAGLCDGGDEFCDGTNDDCPADNPVNSGSLCRASQGDCDVAETCTGTSGACPPNAFEPDTVVCRPSLNGICDSAENCTGSTADCPPDILAPGGTPCRASEGVCDPAETCTGASGACPADSKSASVCRPDTGICDGGSEFCDGTNDDCPADDPVNAGTLCRAAVGECDEPEQCDGSTGACPADLKSTDLCRDAAGDCDIAESCDGTSDFCPANAHSTEVCRPAVNPECDVEEVCDGTADDCPADVLAGECATLDQDDVACTNAICTESGCVVEETCIEICRGPGYYQTHSGYEKDSANVGQEILDALDGGIEVCGQIVDETTDLGQLDSALEGLCMRTQGVKQRQLYRFLLTTAFNCAISEGGNGDDVFDPEECDNILASFVDVKFTDCSALCAGDPVGDEPTLQDCKDQLGCFNGGGRWIDGECEKGTCEVDTDVYCSDDEDCPDEQACVVFEDACTREDLCSEDLTSAAKVCPKKGPASSPKICKDARKNDCTIDNCPTDDTCEGRCGGQAPSGCWCDSLSCGFGDGCADRDSFCDVCGP